MTIYLPNGVARITCGGKPLQRSGRKTNTSVDEKKAKLSLRQEMMQERLRKGLSEDLEEVAALAYSVSEEYGDIWKDLLLSPISADEQGISKNALILQILRDMAEKQNTREG